MGTRETLIALAAGIAAGASSERRVCVTRSVAAGVARADDGTAEQPHRAGLRCTSAVFGAASGCSTGLEAKARCFARTMAAHAGRAGGAAVAGDIQLRTSERSLPGVGGWSTVL